MTLKAEPSLTLEPLNEDHILFDFECGHGGDLDRWLQDKARKCHDERLCSVWLLVDKANGNGIAGFFTLAAHSLQPRGLVAKKHMRDDASNGSLTASYDQHPAMLLGKFAVDREYQGGPTRSLLMFSVYRKHAEIATLTGAKYLVLHVVDKAVEGIYREKHSFTPGPSVGNGMPRTMYKRTSDIEVELARVDERLR